MSISPRVFAIVASLILVLDQWSKYWAVSALTNAFLGATSFGERLGLFQTAQHPRPIRQIAVLDDFWHWRYAENTGAAFSFLANAPEWFRRPFFLAVPVIAMGVIIWYFKKTPEEHRTTRLALALVFGGAVGNFIDRMRLGYVIDFISWHWYDKATWPTFNVADSAISVGVVLLLLFSVKPEKTAI